MFRWILRLNVKISDWLTPHFIFETRAFALYQWVAMRRLLDPTVRRVVDVGAGRTWHFADEIGAERPFELIGVDVDGDELELNGYLDQRITRDVCTGLGVEPNSVDLVLSRATVEHLPDNAGFVRGCFDAVRPGGRLVVVFANGNGLIPTLNRILPNWLVRGLLYALVPNSKGYQGFKAHYDKCSHSAFKKILKNAGFDIEYEYNSYYASSYFQFFFPLYILSIVYDSIRAMIGVRDWSSMCLFIARKPALAATLAELPPAGTAALRRQA